MRLHLDRLEPFGRLDPKLRRVQRGGIRPLLQMKEHPVGRHGGPMAGIVNPRQIGVVVMARITQGHIVAVRVFHPVHTPPEDLARIRGIRHPCGGGLAEIQFRAGVGRGQKVGLAVAGGQLLDPREAPFHLGSIVRRPGLHQLPVQAVQPEEVGIPGIIQAECGLPLDRPLVELPADAHPAIARGAGIDQSQVGVDPAAARRHGNGNAGGGGAGEQIHVDGAADGLEGHLWG